MNLERQKAFLIRVAFIFIIGLLLFSFMKYLVPTLAPFIFGLIVAYILRPLIDKISSKTKLNRTLISIICLLILIIIIFTVFTTIGFKLVAFVSHFVKNMDNFYNDTISPTIQDLYHSFFNKYPGLRPYIKKLPDIDQSINSFITTFSTMVLSFITGFAGMIPSIIIKFLFTMVSTFFFTIDYHKIVGFIMKQVPENKKGLIIKIKNNGIDSIFKFLRAYLILITITFIELSIGLSLLHVKNSILVALLIAIVDILPILGTGAILLPWSIISIIAGNTVFGVLLIVVYIIITVVRQILEPKVVGQQIGLHPIITLICMYVGASLFGILGLFMFPILATIVKNLHDDGSFHIYKQ